ncbi:MAG: UTP--glucose-1-phosphate uridylyltransferase [Phycisphaerales bacterium]
MGPPAELVDRLERAGQGHLLRFYDALSEPSRRHLLVQIATLDLGALPRLVAEYVRNKPAFALPAGVEPAPYYPNDPGSRVRTWDRAKFKSLGEDLLRRGRIAAFTVAGGQGSRLGFEGPKGCFPAGAVTGKPLFQVFAEGLLATGRRHGRAVPWYIMTSPQNHSDTVRFFRERSFFGLSATNVTFFQQGVMPSLDIRTGRVLMTSKHELASNPDGHGGSIRALGVSGAVEAMKRRGVEHVSYFQVDNPIVRVLDPVFLGLHAGAPDSSGEMSSKMIPKAYAEEKLGVFCSTPDARGGGRRVEVIEYSDLPMELQRQRLADGSLRFLAGSIAVHAMSVEFLSRLNTDPSFELPYHRAEKKVACVDAESGDVVEPTEPNAVKLERFVFDALPLCRPPGSIVYETERVEEFAPIKNATGVDSVESSRQIQTERAASWLERAGVKVPRGADGAADCVLEVGPLTAMEAEDFSTGVALPKVIERGAKVAV